MNPLCKVGFQSSSKPYFLAGILNCTKPRANSNVSYSYGLSILVACTLRSVFEAILDQVRCSSVELLTLVFHSKSVFGTGLLP